jgi:hypothetical protein
MSLETLGSLGELLGAIAVFISIVYLAIQIRQQGRLAISQSHGSSVSGIQPFWNWLASDPEFARIYRSGLRDWDAIDEIERLRLNAALMHMVLVFKDVHEAFDHRLIDPPTYRSWVGFVAAHLRMPGGAVWWGDMKKIYIPSIVAVLDEAIPTSRRVDEILPNIWTTRSDEG